MFWLLGICAFAQQMRVCDQEVKSVRMMMDGVACDFPVIPLDGRKVIEVSFDDLRHDWRVNLMCVWCILQPCGR